MRSYVNFMNSFLSPLRYCMMQKKIQKFKKNVKMAAFHEFHFRTIQEAVKQFWRKAGWDTPGCCLARLKFTGQNKLKNE